MNENQDAAYVPSPEAINPPTKGKIEAAVTAYLYDVFDMDEVEVVEGYISPEGVVRESTEILAPEGHIQELRLICIPKGKSHLTEPVVFTYGYSVQPVISIVSNKIDEQLVMGVKPETGEFHDLVKGNLLKTVKGWQKKKRQV